MDVGVLERAGMTRNESLVYLALLSLGTSRVTPILNKSGLNSGKIYEILEGLKRKGLVSEARINNVRHFTAAPPTQILEFLKKREDEIRKQREQVEHELPNLNQLRTPQTTALATTYTGLRGLRSAVEEAVSLTKPGDEMLVMGLTGKKEEKYNKLWLMITKKIMDAGIQPRYIVSDKLPYVYAMKNKYGSPMRYLSALTPVAITVFGEEAIIIFNYEQESFTLIHDPGTAKSFKQFFEQLWKRAEEM